jgi:hypothetical protein
MGEACSEVPEISDLFGESLDAWNQPARTAANPRAPHPGSVEGDKVGLDIERKEQAAPFRAYHTTCRLCGGPKSRGSVRVGVRKNPLRCPKCESIPYAREHGHNTPSPEAFLEARKNTSGATVTLDAPSLHELTILCELHACGGSLPVERLQRAHNLTQRTVGNLVAARWAGFSRRPGPPTLVITERGRQVMRAGLALCLTTPSTSKEQE